jgi:putative oxidoreductase
MSNAKTALYDSPAAKSGSDSVALGFFTLLGRLLLTVVFFVSVPAHFGPVDLKYAVAAGVPFAKLVVPATGLLMLAGALSVLVGYRAKLGAWFLVLFLVPVTLVMHHFWTANNPMMAQLQMGMFIRNVSILGGALIVSQVGAGPWSLDAQRNSRRT